MKIEATQEKVANAMARIRQAGGTVRSRSVSVQGVDANYSFDSSKEELTIRITDKPWLVSESFVEGEIKKFFS